MGQDARDLTRIVLVILTTLGLILSSFWILRPFLLATIWATTIVVATWPLMLRVERRLGRRRWAAVAAMVLVMLVAFVLPLAWATTSIVSHADAIGTWVEALPEKELPPTPAVIRGIPFLGPKIAEAWDPLAAAGGSSLLAKLSPYSRNAVSWLMGRLGGLGAAFIQFALTVVIAGVLYASGETAAAGLRRFGRRLGGDRGENVVVLAGQTVRGVALGVVVTALVQTTLAGLGLAVVGVPAAAVITGVIFILCIAQLGPLPVLIPVTIWVFYAKGAGWGTALAVWSAAVGLLDNFLRPVLIKRGADLPIILIFSGVIGGLVGFGVIGLFVGPVILGVTYTLLKDWVDAPPEPAR